MSFQPVVNEVLESVSGEMPFDIPARTLWLDREAGFVTFISIETPPRKPWVLSLESVKARFESGDLRSIQVAPPPFMLAVEESLPEHAKETRDRNWRRIQPLLQTRVQGLIFYPRMLGQMVSAWAAEQRVPRKTLYRLLYRYWLYGSIQNALLPDRFRCGAPGKEKSFRDGKQPGRPTRYLGEILALKKGILTEFDKQAIKIGFALYAHGRTETIADSYRKMLQHFYRAAKPLCGEESGEVKLLPLSELPSKRQFEYWGKKAFDDIAVLRGRRGERNWERENRGLRGRAREGVAGPCQRFEIDATVADVYLVSRYRRDWIIGRPVVYVVVDVFSGMIVGVFIGLEGPSWDGARHALFNAFTDKVAFCQAHGIAITPEDWPCHYFPRELVGDRGEMLGADAQAALVKGLRVTLISTPPYRPDWKAIVESRFRLLNQTAHIHWIPGAVRDRIKACGERDVRLDAMLDLEQFTQIIIRSILHYNQHHWLPGYLDEDMIRDEVEPVPIEMWNWGLQQGLAQPNPLSAESVYLHLLPRTKGSIQAGGIAVRGMLYTSAETVAANWFARARNKGRTAIEAWYDPWSTEYIWLQGQDKSFIRCQLRASETRYRNFRLEEVLDMLAIIEQVPPEERHLALESAASLDKHIDMIVKAARKQKAANKTSVSAAKRVAGIRIHRLLERWVERGHLNVLLHPAKPVPQVEPSTSSPGSELASSYAGERSTKVVDLLAHLQPKK